MANSYVLYPGQTGAATDYAVSFDYLSRDFVKAHVDGVAAPFTFLSDTIIRFTTAPVGDLKIYRETPTTPLNEFSDGAVLRGIDLNQSNKQPVHIVEETVDNSLRNATDGAWDAANSRIKNVSDPVNDQDAVTKKWAMDAGLVPDAVMAGYHAGAIAAQAAAEAAVVDAQAEVVLAAAEKTGAQTAKTGAEAAKTAAEAARDAALATGKVYPDTTAGLAGVLEGEYFLVPSGDASESFILYRDVAGVATEIKRFPSTAAVAEVQAIIMEEAPLGNAFGISDGVGNYPFLIKDDGTVVAYDLEIQNDLIASGLSVGGTSYSKEYPLGYGWAIVDDDGFVTMGVKDDGKVSILDIEDLATINGIAVASYLNGGSAAAATTEKNFTADINMVLSYGQSLSNGTDAYPVLTTVQRFDNLKFEGGVRPSDDVAGYNSLVPLTETFLSPWGETPIGGATDMIKEMILSEEGLAYTDHTYQMLGSSPGAGGAVISGLSKPGGQYNVFMTHVQNGYTRAQALGKTFKTQAFFWTQGESDYNISTPKATYKALLVQLRNDVDADTKAITGQTEPVVCISYQTKAHGVYGHANDPYLAVAQLEVAKENPHHYVACPLYWATDAVHLSATNSKILGAYYGLCYKRVVIDGIDWKPVMPIATTRQGTLVHVRFHVPVGVLEFDTVFRSAKTNMGFSLVTSGGVDIPLTSVTITGPDTIRVVASSTISAGAKLRYGWATDGGNLRDQQGNSIVFNGNGINRAMHNWCVLFEETLA